MRPPLMLRLAAAGLLACLLSGCALYRDLSPAEITWQALHAVDVAQTVDFAPEPCYVEADPIVRRLIGTKPSTGEVLVWGAAWSLLHVSVTRWLEQRSDDRSNWVGLWQLVTITNTGFLVGRNHSKGVRLWDEERVQPSADFTRCIRSP